MTKSKLKALEEAKQRLAMYEADRQSLVPKLREQSRFKYLGERKVRRRTESESCSDDSAI